MIVVVIFMSAVGGALAAPLIGVPVVVGALMGGGFSTLGYFLGWRRRRWR